MDILQELEDRRVDARENALICCWTKARSKNSTCLLPIAVPISGWNRTGLQGMAS